MDNPDQYYDLRVVLRRLNNGEISQEQYAAWLESIEDSAPDAEVSNVHMVFTRLPGSKDLDGVGDNDGDDEGG